MYTSKITLKGLIISKTISPPVRNPLIQIIHKPGDDAWYIISSEFLSFSGITVWQTDIILKNSIIYSFVG